MKNKALEDTKKFKIQKIQGDYAELICRHHFELMDCKVSKVGIEELSLAFAKLSSSNKGTLSLKKHLQNMPDYLVVNTHVNIASFVEVKYKADVTDKDLLLFSKELHEEYANFIDANLPMYFYVVTNKVPYVRIMKANSFKGRESTGGFYKVEESALDGFRFFQSIQNSKYFNQVYIDSIKPAIDKIIL